MWFYSSDIVAFDNTPTTYNIRQFMDWASTLELLGLHSDAGPRFYFVQDSVQLDEDMIKITDVRQNVTGEDRPDNIRSHVISLIQSRGFSSDSSKINIHRVGRTKTGPIDLLLIPRFDYDVGPEPSTRFGYAMFCAHPHTTKSPKTNKRTHQLNTEDLYSLCVLGGSREHLRSLSDWGSTFMLHETQGTGISNVRSRLLDYRIAASMRNLEVDDFGDFENTRWRSYGAMARLRSSADSAIRYYAYRARNEEYVRGKTSHEIIQDKELFTASERAQFRSLYYPMNAGVHHHEIVYTRMMSVIALDFLDDFVERKSAHSAIHKDHSHIDVFGRPYVLDNNNHRVMQRTLFGLQLGTALNNYRAETDNDIIFFDGGTLPKDEVMRSALRVVGALQGRCKFRNADRHYLGSMNHFKSKFDKQTHEYTARDSLRAALFAYGSFYFAHNIRKKDPNYIDPVLQVIPHAHAFVTNKMSAGPRYSQDRLREIEPELIEDLAKLYVVCKTHFKYFYNFDNNKDRTTRLHKSHFLR